MTNPEKIKQILLSEIEKMDQHREDFCRRPGIDFTRDRKLPFDTLLHFQISMESGSVSHELLKYYNFNAGTPSLSAFYQQRAKLSDNVFQQLFCSFNSCLRPEDLLKDRYQLLAHVMGRSSPLQETSRIPKAIMTRAGALKKAITRCTSFLCTTC